MLGQQAGLGRIFTDVQRCWFDDTADYIPWNLRTESDDFDSAIFCWHSGLSKVYQFFDPHYDRLLEGLNETQIA